jgi:hypothetical protein
MPDPATIEKIESTAAALNGRGLNTLEDLRLWINRDVDKSIPKLAQSSGTAEPLLMALVIAEFCDDTRLRKGRRYARVE